MQLLFTGGTAQSRALWTEALHSLRNLPFDSMPFIENVKFVDPATLSGGTATNFAETLWEYGSLAGEILVRNDAPGFGKADAGLQSEALALGVTYDARLHFHETAVHETGHAVIAAIPESIRLAIAKMFGAKNASKAELYPAGKQWQNRIGEAIAETFKEAFLPARFRVFPNRTNIKLSYTRYPEFRELIRQGIILAEKSEEWPPEDYAELDDADTPLFIALWNAEATSIFDNEFARWQPAVDGKGEVNRPITRGAGKFPGSVSSPHSYGVPVQMLEEAGAATQREVGCIKTTEKWSDFHGFTIVASNVKGLDEFSQFFLLLNATEDGSGYEVRFMKPPPPTGDLGGAVWEVYFRLWEKGQVKEERKLGVIKEEERYAKLNSANFVYFGISFDPLTKKLAVYQQPFRNKTVEKSTLEILLREAELHAPMVQVFEIEVPKLAPGFDGFGVQVHPRNLLDIEVGENPGLMLYGVGAPVPPPIEVPLGKTEPLGNRNSRVLSRGRVVGHR